MEILTKNAEETAEVGRRLSVDLAAGSVLAFEGNLGAGKTTFIQGIADGLGIKSRVNSPTFIIMREYELNEDSSFFHIDLYRIEENIKYELENLGILDLISENKHIFAIEWAEKAEGYLPKNSIKINIENISENERKITIND